eukprot:scaffold17698_cov198-Skeletonema_marinoi.AAC.1
MDKNNNDKDAGASDHSAGKKIDIDHADSGGGSLMDEEKMGEDARAADHPSEETSGNTGLKTPEDEGKKKDISNVQGEKLQGIEEAGDGNNAHDMHEDVQRNNEEATSLPLKGRTIIATTPHEATNTDAAQEAQEESAAAAAAVIDNNDDDESVVVPGFMFIAGPDYTGMGIFTGYDSNAEEDNIDDEGCIILEGFLPEDDPSRRRQRNSSRAAESGGARGVRRSTRERVQRLIDNAITLDDSAVTPIPMDEEGNNNGSRRSDGSGDDEVVKSGNPPWFLPLVVVVLAACVILAIALPLSLRGESVNAAQDMSSTLTDDVCLPGGVEARFELAKSILSNITSPDLLEDGSTPQGKAIRWIVCNDSISVQLLGNQDSSTGSLPKQKHGFRFSGDAEFDPVGVFCMKDVPGNFSAADVPDEFLLNDEDYPLRYLEFNFRMDNNLNGPLPPEFGYLIDCKYIGFENNIGLAGQLPQTMENMILLYSMTLILNGPKFGGELPGSLFRLANLKHIHIQDNLGEDWSLPSNVQVGDDAKLERLLLTRNGFAGTIPSWLAQLNQLQTLDLSMNNFQGAIPSVIGDLSSVKYLNLMGNNLTETIPSSLGKLVGIEALILGNNKLQGELPASIGNLRTLQLLDVGSNEMVSTIPSSFANLESLKYLVLESNRFNGTVDVLESMKKLTVLLIRSNSFSGALPYALFSETSDNDNVAVDIGDNKFTDVLPSSFANMSNLVSLIGAKNSFANSATQPAVCEDTSLLVMDCDACECCEVCCDGENDGVCDFQLDVRTLLGYDCGTWFAHCLQGTEYFAGFGIH